ncbi:MAG TPA: outer membrane beta-barrel protein [Candidatus Acidoferrales bacterium]|nr:outer membrane beta-barrel protein [Candidatus Acidoferrales bacterium]
MRKSATILQRPLFLPAFAALLLLLAAAPSARAQNFADNSKWELGAHYATLNLPTLCSSGATCMTTNNGLGANLTYNFSSWVSFDSTMDFFGDNGSAPTAISGGRVTEGLFGLRFGPTTRKWGFYSVVRPGFVNFSRVLDNSGSVIPSSLPAFSPAVAPFFSTRLAYQTSSNNPVGLLGFSNATDFAFNYGEVIEYRATKHAALRFDIGDTIVTYPGATLGTPFHQHNFQISEALIIRF